MILMAVLTASAVTACSQPQSKETNKMEKKKVLVVYFSATGTTRQAARLLANAAQADLYEIEPVQPYTAADLDWTVATSRSTVEMKDAKSRPAIQPIKADISQYDYVFIGYPIWWDLAPREVYTFIDSHNLQGKTLIPFATSGGSSITGSVANLTKAYPKLSWKGGRLLNGMDSASIKKWADEMLK